MSKTSYKNTKALIKQLKEKLNDLENGRLGLNDLNGLVDDGKDLYEQLIILRYKAFDKLGNSTLEDTPHEPEIIKKSKPAVNAPEPEIETVTETEPEPTPIKEESGLSFDFTSVEEEQPSFDFTMDEPVEKVTDIQPTPAEAVIQKEEPVELAQDTVASTLPDTEEDLEDVSDSLNDIFKKESNDSLRKQLQNSPISDIKTHISIAKKFEYISNMFNSNSEEYEDAIEFLNTCATGNDARLKLEELAKIYRWDLEDKSIINFIELVERRYL